MVLEGVIKLQWLGKTFLIERPAWTKAQIGKRTRQNYVDFGALEEDEGGEVLWGYSEES